MHIEKKQTRKFLSLLFCYRKTTELDIIINVSKIRHLEVEFYLVVL